MKKRLLAERENIKKASSILVVGGGAVGVETVGELI
jgi:NADH dehydrogenase FAD-containing subunit